MHRTSHLYIYIPEMSNISYATINLDNLFLTYTMSSGDKDREEYLFPRIGNAEFFSSFFYNHLSLTNTRTHTRTHTHIIYIYIYIYIYTHIICI